MKVLVPIDGSACGYRALEFGAEFVTRYEGEIHVVHITGSHAQRTDGILDRAKEILNEQGVIADPEVLTDLEWTTPRYGKQIGKDVLALVDEHGHDHVIMGHHGTGALEELVMGSAAKTVVRAADVPATIIP